MTDTAQQTTAVFHIPGTALDRLIADQQLFSWEPRRVLDRNLSELFAQAMDTLVSLYDIASGDVLDFQRDRFIERTTSIAMARRQATRCIHGLCDQLDVEARVYLAAGLNWSAGELCAANPSTSRDLRGLMHETVLELLDGVTFNESFNDFRFGPSLLSTLASDEMRRKGFSSDVASKAYDFAYLLITDGPDACVDVGLAIRGAMETFS